MSKYRPAFEAFIPRVYKGFIHDPADMEAIDLLLDYFFSKESKLDKSLGLVVTGSYGVGKTDIMHLLRAFFAYNTQRSLFLPLDMTQVILRYEAKIDWLFDLKSNVYIDDIGKPQAEQLSIYGVQRNAVQYLLEQYETWRKSGGKIYFTANLQKADDGKSPLVGLYGERYRDIILGGSNVVSFCGQNKRNSSERDNWLIDPAKLWEGIGRLWDEDEAASKPPEPKQKTVDEWLSEIKKTSSLEGWEFSIEASMWYDRVKSYAGEKWDTAKAAEIAEKTIKKSLHKYKNDVKSAQYGFDIFECRRLSQFWAAMENKGLPEFRRIITDPSNDPPIWAKVLSSEIKGEIIAEFIKNRII